MRSIIVVVPFLVLSLAAHALQDSQWTEVRFHRVHLRNGNFIDGNLLQENEKQVLLKLKTGEMGIRRDQIDRIELVKIRALNEPQEVLRPAAPPTPATPRPAMRTAPIPRAVPPPEEALPPLPTPPGVPDEVRQEIDRLVALWSGAPPEEKPDLTSDLGKLGREGFPYLCLLLEKRPSRVPATNICSVLGGLGDVRAIPALEAALKADAKEDRRAAVDALIRLDKPEGVNALLGALADPEIDVWRTASKELVRRFEKDEIPDLPEAVAARMEKASSRIGHAATLGSLNDPRAREVLLELLRKGVEQDMRWALYGLSRNPAEEDGAHILPHLATGGRGFLIDAALYLGKLRHRPAVPELLRLMESDDPSLAGSAHRALQEITGERLAADPDDWKAWYETSALKRELEK